MNDDLNDTLTAPERALADQAVQVLVTRTQERWACLAADLDRLLERPAADAQHCSDGGGPAVFAIDGVVVAIQCHADRLRMGLYADICAPGGEDTAALYRRLLQYNRAGSHAPVRFGVQRESGRAVAFLTVPVAQLPGAQELLDLMRALARIAMQAQTC